MDKDAKPRFEAMDAVKMQTVVDFAMNCNGAKLNPYEMIAVVIAMTSDILTGAMNGVILAEKMGVMSKAEADDAIAGFKELYVELTGVDREFVLDLLTSAAQRHERGVIEKFEQRQKERAANTTRTVTAEQFQRMWGGPTKGES